MSVPEIRLFGDVTIHLDGRPVPTPPLKALELLCYLAVHRDRSHTRDALAETLWPEGRAEVSKRYLRQALWRLNSTVGSTTLLTTTADLVRLNPTAATLDLTGFELAASLVRDLPGRHLTATQAGTLERAVALYRGDLLANLYFDWSSYERGRLQQLYLAMREHLLDYCEANGQYAAGLAHGQIVLRAEPARETTHRRLMRLHYHAGDRTSALRQYDHCRTALHHEFGVAPSAATTRLYDLIRADRGLGTGAVDGADSVSAPTVAELSSRLDEIQASLVALQRALNREDPNRPEETAR